MTILARPCQIMSMKDIAFGHPIVQISFSTHAPYVLYCLLYALVSLSDFAGLAELNNVFLYRVIRSFSSSLNCLGPFLLVPENAGGCVPA